MLKMFVGLFVFVATASAQTDRTQLEAFKKEAPALQSAVEEVINSVVPGLPLLSRAKATYLDGYGIVVTVEAALETPRNPFSSPKTPAEIRTTVSQRRTDIRQRLVHLLQDRTDKLTSLDATESVAIVVHIFNSNPADLPDLPSQLVLTAKKQDSSHVNVREF